MHGVVQQPLVRALGVGHVAHQADAAQGASIGGGQARRLELEPAIAVVGVAHAEIGVDRSAVALLHGPQRQPEALPVGGMQVLGEVVDRGRQLAGGQAEGRLDVRADLDLVAARIPFPDRGAGAIDRQRPAAATSEGAAP